MPAERTLIYWDSCIFIDYFQKHPDRIATLDSIVQEARDKKILLVTSTISQIEAAFAENERPPGRLDPEKLAALDAAWNDRDTLLLVEVHQGIGEGKHASSCGRVCTPNADCALPTQSAWLPPRTSEPSHSTLTTRSS